MKGSDRNTTVMKDREGERRVEGDVCLRPVGLECYLGCWLGCAGAVAAAGGAGLDSEAPGSRPGAPSPPLSSGDCGSASPRTWPGCSGAPLSYGSHCFPSPPELRQKHNSVSLARPAFQSHTGIELASSRVRSRAVPVLTWVLLTAASTSHKAPYPSVTSGLCYTSARAH